MYLGRVLGKAICTCKDPKLSGIKLLLVTKIDKDGKPFGQSFVACDSIGAGSGEDVFLCGGSEASFPFIKARPSSDATILGIIDSIEE